MRKFRFENLKVGKKLLISYGAIILLYLFTILAAVFGITETSRTLDTFYRKAFTVSHTVMDMKASEQGIGRCILDVITGVSEEIRQRNFDDIDSLSAVVDEGLPWLKEGMEGNELVSELEAYIQDIRPIRNEIVTLLKAERYAEALEIFDYEYEPHVREARVCLQKIADKSVERADRYLKNGQDVERQMKQIILGLGAIVLVITTLLWFKITRGITRPVRELREAAEGLAAGKLDVTVSYTAQDELGELAESVRETARALRSYVQELNRALYAIGDGRLTYQPGVPFKGDFIAMEQAMEQITCMLNRAILQIANTADQVAGGSEQIAGGAQVLSQGAVEQAGLIEELAANINEISDSVKNNADDAVRVRQKVDEVNGTVAHSSRQMEAMLDAIGQIRENSKTIGNIAEEIEDIAFQTNLLALNAAVEAARAGEAGRSFTVVASEIRALSVKTTEASRMMAQLSQQAEKTFAGGTAAAEKTAVSLGKVADGADEINGMIKRITEASVHQADAVIQIRQSIELVSEIVQGNSATAEESAAASEELSAQAQELKKLVEEFELS